MSTITKLSKWGTAQGIRIPKPFCEFLDLGIGDSLALDIKDNMITIKKAIPKTNTVESLMAGYDGPQPEEYDWGAPVGKEMW